MRGTALRTNLRSARLMLNKVVRNTKRQEISSQMLQILKEWYLAMSEKKIQPRSQKCN